MSKPALRILVGAVLASAIVGFATQGRAQGKPPADPLAPVSVLVGRWAGTTEGQPGSGTVEREYTHILGSRFLQVRNRSSYPPQDKNPKGEVRASTLQHWLTSRATSRNGNGRSARTIRV